MSVFTRVATFAVTSLMTAQAYSAESQQNLPSAGWHAQTLAGALLNTAIFAGFGILLAIMGYKLFDWCTPGDLHGEIVEKRNVAAALVGGAVIIGVSIIVAASMFG